MSFGSTIAEHERFHKVACIIQTSQNRMTCLYRQCSRKQDEKEKIREVGLQVAKNLEKKSRNLSIWGKKL